MCRRVGYYLLAVPDLLSTFLLPVLALCGLNWAELAGFSGFWLDSDNGGLDR